MILSKSNYIKGLQCHKYLWFSINQKDKIPEADKSLQFRFDQGHLVTELAHKLFPKGILIQSEDFKENLKQSTELLPKRVPLFEAAFSIDDLYSRADILNPVGKEQWDLIEVKSGTKVDEVHIQDIAFQKYCYQKVGLKIRKCIHMHINNEYVKKGEIEPKKIFVLEDVSEQVDKEIKNIPERIEAMFNTLALKKYSEVTIGRFCVSIQHSK